MATILALVPWAGLLWAGLDARGAASGSTTVTDCRLVLCVPSPAHIILAATVGPAAVSAAIAAAIAIAVGARRRLVAWPALVVVLAAAAMVVYGVYLS